MTNQSLALELGKHGQRFCDGSLRWPHHSSHAKIDDVEGIDSEVAQIVMNGIDQFLTRKRMQPGLVLTPASAHLGADHQTIRIGMKRLLDNLVGHVRTVKVAGIDVVDSRCNRLSQNSNRSVHVAWWSPNLWTGELHRAVTHAVQRQRGARERHAFVEFQPSG